MTAGGVVGIGMPGFSPSSSVDPEAGYQIKPKLVARHFDRSSTKKFTYSGDASSRFGQNIGSGLSLANSS